MATIKEIAQLAGVSRGTVDRVLNNRGSVSEETKAKVLAIMKELNFAPNKAGIALAAQKKKYTIGVVMFGEDNPFFQELLDGILTRLDQLSIYGCSVLIRRTSFDPAEQLSVIEELLAQDVHGFLLTPCNDATVEARINELSAEGIPFVTVNSDLPNSKRLAYVGSDFYKGGQTAAGLLRMIEGAKGEIAIVTGSHKVLSHEERILGFKENLHNSTDFRIVDIVENKDSDELSYKVVSSLLQKYPDLSAIFFTAAGVSGGCEAIVAAARPKMPRVVTFDTVPSTIHYMKQGIIRATICQQPRLQGELALFYLVEYLVHGTVPEQTTELVDLSIKITENL